MVRVKSRTTTHPTDSSRQRDSCILGTRLTPSWDQQKSLTNSFQGLLTWPKHSRASSSCPRPKTRHINALVCSKSSSFFDTLHWTTPTTKNCSIATSMRSSNWSTNFHRIKSCLFWKTSQRSSTPHLETKSQSSGIFLKSWTSACRSITMSTKFQKVFRLTQEKSWPKQCWILLNRTRSKCLTLHSKGASPSGLLFLSFSTRLRPNWARKMTLFFSTTTAC